jgi:superfamily I DNA/RNA helicase
VDKRTIYGPPGTGKTTYLMKQLEKALEHTPAERIAFVSYTKKGTNEGAERAKKIFNLKTAQLRHFKTIHALCFRAIGATQGDMVNRDHFRLLSEKSGYQFSGGYTADFVNENDFILHVLSMTNHNPALAVQLLPLVDEVKYHRIKGIYQAMKQKLYLVDFDDLLRLYLSKKAKPLDVDIAFVDEAQDLTTLQWRVIGKLFRNAKQVTVAGDEDQAVYSWAGADFKQFLAFSTNIKVLEKSYRLPQNPFNLAQCITKRIELRQEKEFKPRESKGILDIKTNLRDIKFKGDELILARTNYLLKKLSYTLQDMGIPHIFKGQSRFKQSVFKAIGAYEQFTHGIMSEQEFKPFAVWFKHVDKSVPWYRVIKTYNDSETLYYQQMINSGNYKMKPVKLETFHSCKGSENNEVIVDTSITNKVEKQMKLNLDDELRCLYVALTRTKKALTLLHRSSNHHYDYNYFNPKQWKS